MIIVSSLPPIAISVRQPWAWAIIHAGKDIENRVAKAVSFMVPLRQRIAVHASKGLTRAEADEFRNFYVELEVKRGLKLPQLPSYADLKRGGIIGSVDVVDAVRKSESPWFFGPVGLVLRNALPCEFVPAVGQLGYFKWTPADPSIVPAPARWMLPPGESRGRSVAQDPVTKDLFE